MDQQDTDLPYSSEMNIEKKKKRKIECEFSVNNEIECKQ